MTAPRLRLAVVGCGAVAERGHLPAVALCPEIELAVVVDPVRPRAEALARQFHVRRVAESHHELEGIVDAAIVAVPHALHAPVAVDLLERGISVLVEKPMAVTVAQCDDMIAASTRSGAVLAVGLMRRFQPAIRRAKDTLAEGGLGELLELDVRDGSPFAWPSRSHFFFRREEAGGGVLLNLGTHDIDLLLWWLGDLVPVGYADDAAGGVEADAFVCLETSGGTRCVVELSVTRRLRNTAILRGTRGSVEVPLYEPEPDPMWAQLVDFVEAIRSGRPPLVPGTQGRRSIALIEACYRRRQPLALPWTPAAEPPGRSRSRASRRPGRKILVTGATGFIGGRLVERLVHGGETGVRALVPRLRTAARLARLGVEMAPGSMTDPAAVRSAAQGCDVIFHCAHPREGTPAEMRVAVRQAAQHLADAAAEAKALRLVTLGSFVVYGPHDGPLDETSPRRPSGWSYAEAKLEEEELLRERHRRSALPVVVIQPTIVYGPWGGWWTVGQIELLRGGPLGLPDEGTGLCNAVYVDDVVQALLAAADQGPAGETYLVSAAAPVTWREYYRAFERILGVAAVVPVSGAGPPSDPATRLPEAALLPYYRARSDVRIDKAKRLLGYRPRFDLDRGMHLTAEWARWAGLLS